MKMIDVSNEGSFPPGDWEKLLARPSMNSRSLESTVGNILQEVKQKGDEALRHFSLLFDQVSLEDFEVRSEEINDGESRVSSELKTAIQQAALHIERFHQQQAEPIRPLDILPGVKCWRKSVAIDKVGLYIPGGSAPLFSTILMLGIPAALAGCPERVLCSPPTPQGELHPAILYTARLAGITRVFKVGGAQAIAAMAYGTTTVPKVDKIFGPGNQYVTAAKQLVQKEGTAIDLQAGPSELAVYADQSAEPAFVAADLLSQAEHGTDSQVILVISRLPGQISPQTQVKEILAEIDRQLEALPRKQIAGSCLENSKIFLVRDSEAAMTLINAYAPEHLILACDNAETLASKVRNAGSVFLGHYSPETAGDYASGTNHVLPTNGYAKAHGGVSLDSFVKKISFQQLTKEGLYAIGKTTELMARAEGLEAHARAVSIRLQDFSGSQER